MRSLGPKSITTMAGAGSTCVNSFLASDYLQRPNATSLGTLVFCCGDVIVCHIWQCLHRTSRGHCVLVASGNAQQSPRGMATAVLTTIRNCQARSSSGFYVSTGRGWGVLAPQPHDAHRGPPAHTEVWTFCRKEMCYV